MIERAPFGATGHESSRVIFGAAALAQASKADADRTLELLLEHGINHIDVAAAYGDAELRVAPWLTRARVLPRHQDRRAHATPAAKEEIHRSLERLGVDHVDSIQLHNLVDVIEWDIALSAGGALEAAIEARERGPGALHRRHRPRALGAEDALAQPRALRLRLRAVPVQLRPDAGPALRGDVRRAGARRAPSATSRCRRSRASPARRGRAASTPPRRGTSRSPSRPTSTSPSTGCSATRRRSCSPPATSTILPRLLDAAERYETRPADEEMRALELAPLFT